MIRNCDMSEISDGKLYDINDMVRVGCNDCKGCSDCCKGMGDSIILDPYDIYKLCTYEKCKFEELINKSIELNVVDGIILPNIKMTTDGEKCSYLNNEGRCSIHPYRPAMCRIFPLGRYYTEDNYKYFLQINECKMSKTKIKVKKWIDIPDINDNKEFVLKWHHFLRSVSEIVIQSDDEQRVKDINMSILNDFFVTPYSVEESFYIQFNRRLERVSADINSH